MNTIKFLGAIATLAMLVPFSAHAGNLGTLSETIAVNRTLSIGLSASNSGPWTVSKNTNPGIVAITLSNTQVTFKGLAAGSTALMLCQGRTSNCMDINISVSGVLGSYTGLAYSDLVNQNDVALYGHAVGTWVKQGQTVYYITSGGLIPIPTYKIFLNNGGKDSNVKTANSYDLSRPMLPLMTERDARVK